MQLSSASTFLVKYASPTGATLLLALLLFAKPGEPAPLAIPVTGFYIIFLTFAAVWLKPIRSVSLEASTFRISDLWSSAEIPLHHLKHLEEHRVSRTPNIVLHFDPPTPFGAKVRLLTPAFSFDEVAARLRAIAGNQRLTASQ